MPKTSPIKIIVATHKTYQMPKDPMYLPVQVGAATSPNKTPYQKDSEGKNISLKNPGFSELTALYWAWQNLNVKYLGLVHYRRYFASPKKHKKDPFQNIFTTEEAENIFKKTDIILPKKRHYIIDTLYNHYIHTLDQEPLDLTAKIIQTDFKKYYPEFQKLHTRRSAHMFNMFIMKKELLNDYCLFLFSVLGKLEKELEKTNFDYSQDDFKARLYGRISELLLDVYLRTNHLHYVEQKILYIEPVHWFKKGTSFVKAKLTGKKYDQSF